MVTLEKEKYKCSFLEKIRKNIIKILSPEKDQVYLRLDVGQRTAISFKR